MSSATKHIIRRERMKSYRIERFPLSMIGKIEHQNKAEITDVKEGCLLDNLLYETKRGYLILKETYKNEWTSIYTLLFSTDEQEINKAWEEIR